MIVTVQQKIIKAGFTQNSCASVRARLLLLILRTPESGSATWIRKRIHEL